MARYYGRYDDYDSYGFPPYVSQAARRVQAQQAAKKLTKAGKKLAPVSLEGRRKIATTFWGCAWCDNLERYSDFANRLPRGRSYVRNGSVLDLRVDSGVVTALVSGTDIYTVTINVSPVPAKRWKALCRECAGSIDSMIELLQGRLSTAVMEHICRRETGLFPSPREIELSCSCPDWATMCKHVAAVLYGIGTRLDVQPELLFRLRNVKAEDLVVQAGAGTAIEKKAPAGTRVVANEDLADVFGVELAALPPAPAAVKRKPAGRGRLAATAPKPASGGPVESPPVAKPKARGAASGKKQAAASPARGSTRKAKGTVRGAKARTSTNGRAGAQAETKDSTARGPRARTVKPFGPPKAEATANAALRATRSRRRRTMTAAERKAVSERMRRYWQERKRR